MSCCYVRSELCSVFKATVIHNCWYLEMGFIMKKLLDLRTTFIFTLACLLTMTTAGIWEQSIIISYGYISYIWSISNLLCYVINATVIVISRIKLQQLCLGNSWSSLVPQIFEHICNFWKILIRDFFLGKKERHIHTFNKWLSNMPLVLSFANLNPCVDLNANVFRERDTNVIRSLQDFTAIRKTSWKTLNLVRRTKRI